MKIGIIGTGMIGGTLARKFVANGHQVKLANSRGAAGAKPLADEIGASAVDVGDAVSDVDAIVVTIPFPAVQNLPKGLLASVPANVPVIDTGNYYPDLRDPRIEDVDGGMPESVWSSKQLGRPVIKAFNNIIFASLGALGKPAGTPGRVALTVSADDPAQKATAMALVEELGFDAIDAGSLADSWRNQPGSPGYCCDYDAGKVRKGLATADRAQVVINRDAMLDDMRTNPPASLEAAIERSRKWNGIA